MKPSDVARNIIVAIIVLLPILGIIAYWYGVYCLWNGLLMTTALHAIFFTCILFVVAVFVGAIISAILLALFGMLLNAALK